MDLSSCLVDYYIGIEHQGQHSAHIESQGSNRPLGTNLRKEWPIMQQCLALEWSDRLRVPRGRSDHVSYRPPHSWCDLGCCKIHHIDRCARRLFPLVAAPSRTHLAAAAADRRMVPVAPRA